MVDNYNSGAGSYAYLLDGDGGVIAHPDRQQVTELYNYKTMKKSVLVRDANGENIKDEKSHPDTLMASQRLDELINELYKVEIQNVG